MPISVAIKEKSGEDVELLESLLYFAGGNVKYYGHSGSFRFLKVNT